MYRMPLKQILRSLIVVSLVACLPGTALTSPLESRSKRIGTDSSGGGDHVHRTSSAEQVRAAIQKIKLQLPYYFMHTIPNDLCSVQHPALKRVLTSFLSGGTREPKYKAFIGTEIEKDIGATTITIKEDGPCRTLSGHDSDAAVAAFQRGSSICFSVPRLREIPPEALYKQIIALAAHEFAHHFGYGEEEAVLLQNYFLAEVLSNQSLLRQSLATDISRVDLGQKTCADLKSAADNSVWLLKRVAGLGYEPDSGSPEIYQQYAETHIRPLVNELTDFQNSVCNGQINAPEKDQRIKALGEKLESLSRIPEDLFPRKF